jgi:hypothetical protein
MSISTSSDTAFKAARNSFQGRSLTRSQFRKAWALSSILHTEIKHSGTFREALTSYAHAYARSEKFDAWRGEVILRDVYQGRYGQTLNTTRKTMLEAEQALPAEAQSRILQEAETIPERIEKTQRTPFYQAYDISADTLSTEFNITEAHAKTLMKDAYEAKHRQDLYTKGKEAEAKFFKPERREEKITPQPKEMSPKQQ